MKEENRGPGGHKGSAMGCGSMGQLCVTRWVWNSQSARGNHVCEGPESDIGRCIHQLLLCNK